MEKKIIRSTSLASADCSDVVLRTTATTRLTFRPQLVDNPHDHAAAVHGIFLFQRKGPKCEWEDSAAIPLSTLKKGEGVRLELHAAEVLMLFREIAALYKLHSRDGIPLGETELIRADSVIAQLDAVPRDQLRTFLTAHRAIGEELLVTLLSWATELQSPAALVPRLVSLESTTLQSLNAAVGLETLKRALKVWDNNSTLTDEELWQHTLTENSFVLEQVFSWPSTIVKGKAYVGGKSVMNTGGNIVDFLLKNYLTNNAALVEIKTPQTALLGREYRSGVHNPSEELTGSVMRVANYRFSLQRDFYSLEHGVSGGLESFEPRCVVIIGNTSEVTGDDSKARSLELYRAQTTSVGIITFDELFQKTKRLIEVLEETGPIDSGRDV
jgi:Shedu protein SduA, N-terminal/Shedu protein SduA, C-terminal